MPFFEDPADAGRLLGELRRRETEIRAQLVHTEERVRNALQRLVPAAWDTSTGRTGESGACAEEVPEFAAPYILVVDLHEASRIALAELLREKGYPVREAGTSDDLPAQEGPFPALVILDPGPFVSRAILAVAGMRGDPATAAIPVLLLAPILSQVDRDDAISMGCTDCLLKPAHPAEVLGAIERFMKHPSHAEAQSTPLRASVLAV